MANRIATKCRKCQFENHAEAVFCAKCGIKIETAERNEKGTSESGVGWTRAGGKGNVRNGPPLKFGHQAKPSVTKTLETTPQGLGKGELFAGRFELIEELGAGGMGIVYRAYDKEVGEEIALKVLNPDIALDQKTVDRFRNEIKLARRITHKNVCQGCTSFSRTKSSCLVRRIGMPVRRFVTEKDLVVYESYRAHRG